MPNPDTSDRHRLAELARRQARALAMGGLAKIARQHELSRLTARERVARLLDADSFYEIGQLAHSARPDARDKTPADGRITGYGTVAGQLVGVSADDVTIMAGAGGQVGYRKEYSIVGMAQKKGFPAIILGEGGGARIPDIMGAVGMMSFAYPIQHPPRDRAVPVITAIMGECYGGPMWEASVSDVVVQVKGAVMAVAGPPILEIATGERVTKEALGGWQQHARVTGLVDLFAEDDADAIRLIQRVLTYLPANAAELPPVLPAQPPSTLKQNSILNIIPADDRYSYDMHRILACIVDVGSLLELKPFYDGSLITTLARIDGQVVGILANNPKINAGAMGPGACEKAVSFIILCDSFHIPLIFLHDTPGFYVSQAAENNKMPVRIMDFINALHHCTVPRITLFIRKSYGMASNNMMGGNMGADFTLAWPTADISFSSPEVAFNVVLGRKVKDDPNRDDIKRAFLDNLADISAPWEPAGLGLIDRIIDPRQSRQELIRALQIANGQAGSRHSGSRYAGSRQAGGRSKRLMASWNKM